MGLFDDLPSNFAGSSADIDGSLSDIGNAQGDADVSSAASSNQILVYPNHLKDPSNVFKTITFTFLDPGKTYELINDYIRNKNNNFDPSGENEILTLLENMQELFRIVLPLPNQFDELNGHDYSTDGGIVTEVAQKLNNSMANAQKFTQAFIGRASEASGVGNIAPLLPGTPQIDPFKWQNFTGSKLRNFSFAFKMIPRNVEEANTIMKIMYNIKRYSYPSKTFKALMFLPPARVRIKFGNPMLHKLINPGICVITDVNTTYDDGTNINMHTDGVPKSMTFTLSMVEFCQKFREDWS